MTFSRFGTDDLFYYRYGFSSMNHFGCTFKLRHVSTLVPSQSPKFMINLIMFPCKYCPERYAALSARGLTQHHRKCQAFLKHEAKANQRRKTTVASNKARRTKLRVKLDDRKVRLGSGAPGVSIFQ
jgi:hypothetical protein